VYVYRQTICRSPTLPLRPKPECMALAGTPAKQRSSRLLQCNAIGTRIHVATAINSGMTRSPLPNCRLASHKIVDVRHRTSWRSAVASASVRPAETNPQARVHGGKSKCVLKSPEAFSWLGASGGALNCDPCLCHKTRGVSPSSASFSSLEGWLVMRKPGPALRAGHTCGGD